MSDDKLKPNPDVKWGKPNRRSSNNIENIKSDYLRNTLDCAARTLELLKSKFHSGILEDRRFDNEVRIEVEPALIPYVLEFLCDHMELQYRYLSQVAGAEWHKGLQSLYRFFYVTYDLYSFKLHTRIFVYAVLPRESPKLPSVVHLFRTADWHEREVYDLFGIEFEGHPSLKRILLPPNFDGHPLLKDYPVRGKDVWNLGKNVIPSNLEEILGDYNR